MIANRKRVWRSTNECSVLFTFSSIFLIHSFSLAHTPLLTIFAASSVLHTKHLFLFLLVFNHNWHWLRSIIFASVWTRSFLLSHQTHRNKLSIAASPEIHQLNWGGFFTLLTIIFHSFFFLICFSLRKFFKHFDKIVCSLTRARCIHFVAIDCLPWQNFTIVISLLGTFVVFARRSQRRWNGNS